MIVLEADLADWKHVLRSLSADEAPQGCDLVCCLGFMMFDASCQGDGGYDIHPLASKSAIDAGNKKTNQITHLKKPGTLEENYVHEIIRQILRFFRHFLQF